MPPLDIRRGLHSVHFHAAQAAQDQLKRSAGDHPSLPIIIPVVILGSLCLAFCLWVSYAEWSPWFNKIRRTPVTVAAPASTGASAVQPETRQRP